MIKLKALVIIMVLIILVFTNVSYCVDVNSVIGSTKLPDQGDKVGSIMGKTLGVIQVIGLAVAIIMLIVLGIKYMTSAPNEKAELKKHAVPYIVGAIFVFAASGIIEIIKVFALKI